MYNMWFDMERFDLPENYFKLHSKIVGNTFVEGGQELLQQLEKGGTLILKPEPENKYDENAIAVYNTDKEKLGYIPKETAKLLNSKNTKSLVYRCTVEQVTGGTRHKCLPIGDYGQRTFYGCNILVEFG